jgi:hypothetical protein
MYKGTRHTRSLWNYKPGAVHVPGFDSDEQCRALVEKSQSIFVPLGLLRDTDFEEAFSAQKSRGATSIVGVRLRRNRQRLVELGVPQSLVFSVPAYLLVAPKLMGLLSRIARKSRHQLPAELAGVHEYFRANPVPAHPNGDPKLTRFASKTLFHVAKDGTRTAFESKPVERQRRKEPSVPIRAGGATPNETSSSHRNSREQRSARPTEATAISLALQKALLTKKS